MLIGDFVEVLWVKGLGGDVGIIKMDGFVIFYMDKFCVLKGVYCGVDFEDEMVGYLLYCIFNFNFCVVFIDMLLYVYVLKKYVDYMYFDVIIVIVVVSDSKMII